MGESLRFSNKTQRNLSKLTTYAQFPYLIVIKYKDNNDVLYTEYYVNKDNNVTYQEHIYNACFFKIKPPTRNNSSVSDGEITFSTVDQTWIQKVRNCKGRITCEFVACIDYSAVDTENVIEEIDHIKFTLIKAQWNESTIRFTMMYDDRQNLLVPSDICSGNNTPALV